MNQTKLNDLIELPRTAFVEQYATTFDEYVVDSDTNSSRLTEKLFAVAMLIPVVFILLGIFVSGLFYFVTPLIVLLIGGLMKSHINKKAEQDKIVSREIWKTAAISVSGIIKKSPKKKDTHTRTMVMVYARNDNALQADIDKVMEVTKQLREYSNQEFSKDPLIKYVQECMKNSEQVIHVERLDPKLVGCDNLYWSVHVEMPQRMGENLDIPFISVLVDEKIENKLVGKNFANDFLS